MRVYLDCCSLQRPYSMIKSQPRIAVEERKRCSLFLRCDESDRLELISSDLFCLRLVVYPLNLNGKMQGKEDALAILKIAKETLELTPAFEELGRRLGASGLKPLDALHLAFASASKADYFCTCDDKLLKKANSLKGLDTKVVSPTELVMGLDI